MLCYLKTKRERGQGLVEYALLIILIAIVVMATLSMIPPPVANIFNEIGATLTAH
jgi:pilus assembly protein Flp/PilA